jgi:hypothetical protein
VFAGVTEAPLTLPLGAAPWELTSAPDTAVDSGIAGSSTPVIPKPDLLEYSDVGSAAAAVKEGGLVDAGDAGDAGLNDLLEPAAGDEAAEEEDEEREGKTDPSSRFALSREASFLNSMRLLEGFLGSRDGGDGFRSAAKPAGKRVMCIECGLRGLGRHGGVGNRAGSDGPADTSVGV